MSDEDRLRRLMDRARGKERSDAADWERFTHRAHRRLFMNRAAAAGLALVLVAGGAAIGTTVLSSDRLSPDPIQPAQTDTVTSGPVEPSPSDAGEPLQEAVLELWFTEGEYLYMALEDVEVDGDLDPSATAALALSRLFDGPNVGSGLGTTIPTPTQEELHLWPAAEVADGLAIAQLPASFETGGGSLSMQMRVAQVVFTLTQFDEVEGVLFEIEGERRDHIGGEGIDVSEPLTRRDFDDLAPPIVVETPRVGDAIRSPVSISGTANVYEANVNIRILDENGEVLNETFVTATCGTGCRGTYEKAVSFDVDHEQPGTVEVLTYSAEDGSPMFTVSVPVKLVP